MSRGNPRRVSEQEQEQEQEQEAAPGNPPVSSPSIIIIPRGRAPATSPGSTMENIRPSTGSTWISMRRSSSRRGPGEAPSSSATQPSHGADANDDEGSPVRRRFGRLGDLSHDSRPSSFHRNMMYGMDDGDDDDDDDEVDGEETVQFYHEEYGADDTDMEEPHDEDDDDDDDNHDNSDDNDDGGREDDNENDDRDSDEVFSVDSGDDSTSDDDGDGDGSDPLHTGTHDAASFEDLPSLLTAANRHLARAAKRSRAKERPKADFIPKYLEKTAYGTLHRRLLDKSRANSEARRAGLANGRSLLTTNGADSEMSRVPPDLFFRSLVQDSWPHYCTPNPSVSAFTGLRLGYGLGLGDQFHTMPADGVNGSSGTRGRGASTSNGSQPASTPQSQQRRQQQERQHEQEQQHPSAPHAQADSVFRRQHPASRRSQRAAGSGTKPSDTADEGQDLPTEWHPLCESSRMTIGPDRLSVQYTGPGRQDADAAQVQANNCIPARSGVYYFELHIKSRGQSGYIGIGLSLYGIGAHRLPGWDEGSWGYHGDDGNSFGGDGHGHPYGPGFTTGDTVGCGIDFMLRRIFFTRNGFFLGYAFKDIDISKDLYPCVGMRTPGEHVVANFGHKAFAYDIDHYVSEAHDSALVAVSATSIKPLLPAKQPPKPDPKRDKDEVADEQGSDPSGMDTLQISRELLHIRDGELGTVPHGSDIATSDATLSIILSHLLDNEHYATARALIENIVGRSSSEAAARNERLADILKVLGEQDLRRAKRKRICRYICEGDIDYSLGLLQESYPQVLEDESLVFQLRCRQFIELVRAANGYHIADCIPNDDSQLASTTAAQETAASAPMGGRDKHEKPAEDMMDVDDTKSPSMMSLAAITNAPNTTRGAPFGQIKNLRKMEPAQLVRVLLEYGRQLQADYGSSPNPIIREGLVHTFSLLAYADPAQSPIYALLDPEACKPLARLVELAVIASEKEPRASSLERIYRQTSVLLNELSAGRNGAASLISIERDFLMQPNVGAGGSGAEGSGALAGDI